MKKHLWALLLCVFLWEISHAAEPSDYPAWLEAEWRADHARWSGELCQDLTKCALLTFEYEREPYPGGVRYYVGVFDTLSDCLNHIKGEPARQEKIDRALADFHRARGNPQGEPPRPKGRYYCWERWDWPVLFPPEARTPPQIIERQWAKKRYAVLWDTSGGPPDGLGWRVIGIYDTWRECEEADKKLYGYLDRDCGGHGCTSGGGYPGCRIDGPFGPRDRSSKK